MANSSVLLYLVPPLVLPDSFLSPTNTNSLLPHHQQPISLPICMLSCLQLKQAEDQFQNDLSPQLSFPLASLSPTMPSCFTARVKMYFSQ